MGPTRRLLCVLTFVAACRPPPPSPRAAPPPAPPAPVVLISIDGLRPDYVLRADALGLAVPNLRRLVAEGSYADGVRGVLPTVTYPSHATMLTGVSPARHGIYANTTFDPEERNQGGWHWYAEDVRAPTLWGAARAAGLATASVFWPVNVGAPATFVVAEVWRADAPDDRKLTRALSTPGLVAELERALGPLPGGRDWGVEADEARARFAARVLATKRPSFLALHLLALDTEQHARGPFAPSAFDVLERLDAVVGRVRAAADASAAGGRAVVGVVSDHGFAEVDTEVNLKAALCEAGLVELDERGRVASWRAAAWLAGASAAIVLRDPADADAERRAGELLRRLSEGPDAVVGRVLRAAEAAAGGGFPTARFVVELRPRHYFGTALRGPVVVRDRPPGAPGYRGMHGFLPDDPAMNAAFFLAGAGVPARRLGLVDLRDVAPTLAGLLGVGLPSAEGRDLLAAPAAAAAVAGE